LSSPLVRPPKAGFTPRERGLLAVPIVLLLLGALALAYETRPYQELIAHFTTSLSGRSLAQRQNIEMAVRRLDGAVIGPGERCSFNALVGPRTISRGFTEANAFLEGARTRSLGGGVCQVSSTLYAALQETSLPIVQRVPHFAIVSSVPPGRDASVWYGKADLVWENALQHPVKLVAKLDELSLRLELWGTGEQDARAALRFSYRFGRHAHERQVWVYRRVGTKNSLLSQDTYKIPGG
jgi:vancomycin resistance protein VanW